MAEDKRIVLSIGLDTTQFVDAIAKSKDKVAELKSEQQKLKEAAAQALTQGLTAEYEKFTKQLILTEAELKVANTELKRNETQLQNVTLATKAADGSYEQLYQQWKVADAQLKNLAGTLKKNADGTVELTEEYKKAKTEVENAKKALNEFGLGVADGRLNVGNYAAALEGVIAKSGLFGNALTTVKEGFQGAKEAGQLFGQGVQLISEGFTDLANNTGTFIKNIPNNFTTATESVKNFTSSLVGANKEAKNVQEVGTGAQAGAQGFSLLTKATNIFKVALISTGIGAFLVAAGALVAFFTKTKEGSEKLAQGLSFLGGLFRGFVDVFAKAGKTLFEVISEPKKAFESLIEYGKSVVVPYFKGLGNILKGVFTLDFDSIEKGVDQLKGSATNAVAPFKKGAEFLKEAGTNAARVAQESAKITAENQKIADSERKIKAELAGSKEQIEALFMAAKDQTKSTQERVALIKQAGEIEQKYTTQLIALAQQKYDLKVRENKLADAGVEALEQEAALLTELNNLKGQARQLDEKVATETRALNKEASDKAKQARQVELQNDIEFFNLKLENQRRAGEDTLQTQLDIAKKQRDLSLAGVEAGSNAAKGIELKYQNDILKIQEAYNNEKLALQRSAEDLRLSQIADGQTREIQQEAVALQRKLADIKGNSAEELALREALKTESAEKIRAIQDKYDAEELAKVQEALTKSYDEQIKAIDKGEKDKLAVIQQEGQARLNELKILQAQGLVTEDEIVQAQVEIEQAKLKTVVESQQARLDEVKKYAEQRKANETKAFADEQARLQENFDKGLLTQEQFLDKSAELNKKQKEQAAVTQEETGQQVLDAEQALADARINLNAQTEQAIVDERLRTLEKQKELDQALYDQTVASLTAIQGALDADVKSNLAKQDKRYKDELKKLDERFKKGLISQDQYNKEKAKLDEQNEKNSEEIAKRGAAKRKAIAKALLTIQFFSEVSNILLGASKDTASTGIIGGAALYALAAVQIAASALKYKTGLDGINAQEFAKGGFTNPFENIQGTKPVANIINDYKPVLENNMQGGFVKKPTLWALAGERGSEYIAPSWQLAQAPELFNMLNNWRVTRVRPFADGGFTQSQLSSPLFQTEATEQALVRAFASAPAPIVTVEDINLVQNRVSIAESRASI